MDVAGDDEDDDYGYPPVKKSSLSPIGAGLPPCAPLPIVTQQTCRTCGRPYNLYAGEIDDDHCCGEECAAIAYDMDAEMIDVPWWFQ